MKVGVKQISELSGFSVATVSNVLNNKKGVNANTAQRVLKVARDIGYLASAKVDRIKLVMYQKTGKVLIETPLISALLDGVETENRKNGFDTIVCNLRESDPNFEVQLSALLNERSSGILLLATEMEPQDIRRFSAMSVPMVVVDSWFESEQFDTVLMNNTDSAINAAEYLIENGHQKIGNLRSNITIRNFHYRRLGLEHAMARHKLRLEERFCVDLDPTINGAYEDMKAYLARSPALPTAYYADNDIIAIGAMKALFECGYRVPDDVSIVGFDNMPFSEMTSPRLTTLDVPKRELGVLAARRLAEQIKSDSYVPARTEVLTRLIVRDSVRRIEE
jgi:LacI family transcriptional regulator